MNQQQDNDQPGEQDNLNTNDSAVYFGDSSMQTKTEFEQDKKGDKKENDTVTSSGVDDLQFNSDGAAGTDRAGTAERKTYGDIELNKGLEAQAKDEES